MERWTKRSDAALVRQTLAGKSASFEQLVLRHAHTARAMALAHVRTYTDAEDVVQEAFVEAFRCLNTLRDPARFGAWLGALVRHRAARVKAQRKREAEFAESHAPTGAAVEPDPGQREMWMRVRQAVEELDPDMREAVVLRYFAGKTSREIGAILDLAPATVRKRLQRARHDLAETLLREAGAEDLRDERSKKGIVAAVTAATPDWSVKHAGAAGILGSGATGFLPTAMVGCAIVALLGGSLWYFNAPSTTPPTTTQAAEATTATDAPTAPTRETAAIADRTDSSVNGSDAQIAETWPIHVYVVDENGDPQEDLPVTMAVTEFGRPNLTPFQNWAVLHTSRVRTNDRGVATFARIPAFPNLSVAHEISAHTAERMGLTRVSRGGLHHPEIEWTLNLLPAESISGFVVDESGQSVPGATLRLYLHQKDPTLNGHTMSDSLYTTSGSDGRFVFPQVVRGSARLAVQAQGYSIALSDDLNTGAQNVRIEMERGRWLEGTARFKDSGEPATNVRIVAESNSWLDLWTAVTDDTGRFVFDSLSAAEYTLWSADPVLVLADVNERVDLEATDRARRTLEVTRGGSVEGIVTEADTGAPLSNAVIAAAYADDDASTRPQRNTQLKYVAETDNDGRFLIEGLPPGSYAVACLTQPLLSGQPWELESAFQQTDVQADETQTVSLRLKRRRDIQVISGRVVGPDGDGMPGFDVIVSGTNSEDDAIGLNPILAATPRYRPAKTGADGSFSAYPPETADAIYLRANRPGWVTQTLGPISLDARDTITVELNAQRAASIAGHVVTPVGNNQIRRVHIESAEHGPLITLGLGGPSGFRAVEGLIARDDRFFAGALYPGDYSVSVDGLEETISLAPGEQLDGVKLQIPDVATAGGTVTGRAWLSGEPLRSAKVSVRKQSDATDEDGRFRIVNAEPGRQHLNVNATQMNDGILTRWDVERAIQVTRGKTLEVDVALGSGTAAISGSVLANGNPLLPFSGRVRLAFGDTNLTRESISVKPNSRGEYRIAGIPAGVHTIRYEYRTDDQYIRDSIEIEFASGDSLQHDFHFSMGSVRVRLEGMQANEDGRLVVVPSETVESTITGPILETLLEAAVIDKTVDRDGDYTFHATFADNNALYFGAWDKSLNGTDNILANMRATSALAYIEPGETTEIALRLP